MKAAEHDSRLRGWLREAGPLPFSLYAIAAAFTIYFCMYAFRKPFAVAEYSGRTAWGLSLKDALIISQILGYALSKVAGVKLCSELGPARRALPLVALILAAEGALALFGMVPDELKLVAIFLNGIPLGMVWGLVFGFLEGRRTTDLLGAGLSCSYIMASGVVKSVGELWLQAGVSEDWMPFICGLLFLPVYLIAVWFLAQLPPPSAEDVEQRSKRERMDGGMRLTFLRRYLWGVLPLLVLYFFLTAYRDFRDNYAKEIWSELGLGDQASIYALPEIYIAFGVLACVGLLILIKRNRAAVWAVYAMMAGGMVLVGLATLGFDAELVSGPVWMTLVGLGLYLTYVPFGFVLFDRLVALLRSPGNAIFGIYLADVIGYSGSISVILYKHFGHAGLSELQFFRSFSYLASVLCVAAFAISLALFLRRAPA